MNKVTSSPTWRDSALFYANAAKDKAVDFYKEASQPGITQQKVLAAARAAIGIAAIYQTPGSALCGVGLAAAATDAAEVGTQCLDGMITGLWNKMSFNQKISVSTVGSLVVLSNVGVYLIAPCTTIFAAKIGAEFVLNNLHSEKLAALANENEANAKNERLARWQKKFNDFIGIKNPS